MKVSKSILMVVTSHAEIKEGIPTGIWLSEFAEAYIQFTKEGYEVTVSSLNGGKAVIDPRSINENTPQEILDTTKYLDDTIRLDDVSHESFHAIFLPGGHGTMFDLPNNKKLSELLVDFYEEGKIVAAVCHGPAGLINATLYNGQPLVSGKTLTAFTNEEERATKLDQFMPFLLETRLRELGAKFVKAANWSNHVEIDGTLITGQNPQSTISVANEVIKQLC